MTTIALKAIVTIKNGNLHIGLLQQQQQQQLLQQHVQHTTQPGIDKTAITKNAKTGITCIKYFFKFSVILELSPESESVSSVPPAPSVGPLWSLRLVEPPALSAIISVRALM